MKIDKFIKHLNNILAAQGNVHIIPFIATFSNEELCMIKNGKPKSMGEKEADAYFSVVTDDVFHELNEQFHDQISEQLQSLMEDK